VGRQKKAEARALDRAKRATADDSKTKPIKRAAAKDVKARKGRRTNPRGKQ
jgi:hypothetical protein